jgi:hypothetical protein
MIWAIIIIAIIAYFYKGSRSYYFFKSQFVLDENWKEIEHLLILKGHTWQNISKYRSAYDYFCAYPMQYDGATIVKDLCDIPELDLDAMLHDYESITFASRDMQKWIISAVDYFKNMAKNGKGNQVIRLVGLLIIGLFFVPYRKFFKN